MTTRSRTIRISVVGDARQIQSMFGQLGQSMGRLTGTFGQLAGLAGIGGVAFALKRLGTEAVELSVKYEQAMAKIVGLTGVAREQVDQWAEDIKGLSAEVGRSPLELADALYFIASAGVQGTEALEVLNASARAAAAGMGETKDIAFAAVSALNAYGKENISAAQAVDIIAKAVKEGNVEAAELAPVLGRVIPIAAELGVEFDQVGAALAAMTRLGLDADESATSLRQILVTLLKPSAGAAQKLRDFGLSAMQVRRQLREEGLLAVLLTLRDRFADNEEAMGRVFPNVRALAGVLNLVGNNAEEAQAIFDSLTDSTGFADSAFETMAETAGFKLAQAMSALKVVGIEVGDKMMPAIIEIVQAAVPVLETLGGVFSALVTVFAPIAGIISGIVSAFAPLLEAFGGQIATIIILVKTVNALRGAFVLMSLAAKAATTNFASSAKIQGGLATAFSGLTLTVTAAVAAFTIWQQVRAADKERSDEFKATLDDETAALTSNTDEYIRNTLARDDDLRTLNELGLTISDFIAAVAGEEAARRRVVDAIHAEEEALRDKGQVFGQEWQDIQDLKRALHQLEGARRSSVEQTQAEIEAKRLEAGAYDAVAEAAEMHRIRQEAATGATRDHTAAAQAEADVLSAVARASADLRDSQALLIDTKERLAVLESEGMQGTEAYAQALLDVEAATKGVSLAEDDLASAMGDGTDATDDAAESAKTLTDRLLEAQAAQESLAGVMRAAVDPVYAAVRAVDDLAEAEAEMNRVNNDGTSTTDERARAQFDYYLQLLETQTALDDLKNAPGGVTEAIRVLAEASGESREAIIKLLEELGILDGKQITTVLRVQAPVISYRQTDENQMVPFTGRTVLLHEGGVGLPRAGGVAARIADGGVEEAVIPLDQRGMSFLVEALRQALGSQGGGYSQPAAVAPSEVTLIVELDGHVLTRALLGPLVDRIRVKTGVKH